MWRSHDKFESYKRSFDKLNEDEKQRQTKKRTRFFMEVRRSIMKHFNIWIEQHLFFLSTFSNQKTATCIAKIILGRESDYLEGQDQYFCEFHNCTIDLFEFDRFVREMVAKRCEDENGNESTVLMETRKKPTIQQNQVALVLIANGCNIWEGEYIPDQHHNDIPSNYRRLYLYYFAAIPTNTQLTERAVKLSGYVTLGKRDEATRTIFCIARGRLLQDALKSGKLEVEDEQRVRMLNEIEPGGDGEQEDKKIQVANKRRTRVLLNEILQHKSNISRLKNLLGNQQYQRDFANIKEALTKKTFNKQRVLKKVEKMRAVVDHVDLTAMDAEEEDPDFIESLTPFMLGKLQYSKLRKQHNRAPVEAELRARGIAFERGALYSFLIGLLKTDEKDDKFFKPRIDYDSFTVAED